MEPRSAVGEYDAKSGRLTLNLGSQGVHGIQGAIAGAILKIPPESLRVVTQDVGGGFGTKAVVYREYPLVLEAAKRLGRASAGSPIAASISSATRKAATI